MSDFQNVHCLFRPISQAQGAGFKRSTYFVRKIPSVNQKRLCIRLPQQIKVLLIFKTTGIPQGYE